MYVCLCKAITDSHIKDAVYGGATTVKQVRQQLGIMSQCGKCGVMTKQIVDEALSQHTAGQEQLFYAAV